MLSKGAKHKMIGHARDLWIESIATEKFLTRVTTNGRS